MPTKSLSSLFAAGSLAAASALTTAEPLLDVRMVGLHEVEPADKDAAVYRAFLQLGERLADLQTEIQMEPTQADAIALGWDVLTGGLAVRIDSLGENGPNAIIVARPGGRATAESVYARIGRLIDQAGLPADREAADAMTVDTPAGPVGLTADARSVYLRLGEPGPARTEVERGDLPEGVRPLLSGQADMGGIMALIGPQIEAQMDGLPPSLSVWMGPDAPRVRFEVGADDARVHATQRWFDAADAMAVNGLIPGVTFGREDFRKVPRDAVRLYAFPVAIDQYLATLDMLDEQAGQDVLAEIDTALGVSLRDDLLAHVDRLAMIYQSETTGGGGMYSTVLLLALSDPIAFQAAHEQIVERANEAGAERLNGYVRIRSWDQDGVTAYALTVPGLPVPLEPAWAIVGDRLVAAVSPAGLRAAIDQIARPASSVLDNPLFARAVVERTPRAGLSQVKFADAPRLARKGYGLTAALTAAIANAVRSPLQPDRVAGPLMPDYAEFVAGVEPSATIGWWDGDDYRIHAVGDASMLVGLASGLGSIADMQGIILPAFGAGVLLPAIGKARQTANQLKSSTQVRTVVQAALAYATAHDDRMPDSLEVMLDEGMLRDETIVSPFGPAPDGGPSIAYRAVDGMTFSATEIIAIDRTMMFSEGVASVGFADGHVELLTYPELERVLDRRENNGAREALGIIEY